MKPENEYLAAITTMLLVTAVVIILVIKLIFNI